MVNQAWATTSRRGGISALLPRPPPLATARGGGQGRRARLWIVGRLGPGRLWTAAGVVTRSLADDLARHDPRGALCLPAEERVRLPEQRSHDPGHDERVVAEPERPQQDLGHEVDGRHDVQHTEQGEQDPPLGQARVPPAEPELEHARDGAELGADPRRARSPTRTERPRERDERCDATLTYGHRRLLPDSASDSGRS